MRLDERVLPQLTGTDVAAVASLLELAKRVRRVQEPLRQVERALCPTEELNQVSMFSEPEP